jgi:hypothetical protein
MSFYGLWPEAKGPVGGGTYNDDERGAESQNFEDFRGEYLAYVRSGSSGEAGLNLRRIDPASRDDEKLDDVLVIFVAKRPDAGGQVVVGWYTGATCLASVATQPSGRPYAVIADPKGAVLLPAAERTIPVPKGAGAMGQANVAYAFQEKGQAHDGAWIDDVIQRVLAYQGPNLVTGAHYDDEDSGDHIDLWFAKALQHVKEKALPLWRGMELRDAPDDAAFDWVAIGPNGEERIFVCVSETDDADVEFTAEELDAIRASGVAHSLLVITNLTAFVRNGQFVFRGGNVYRESPFMPQSERLTPTVFRYAWKAGGAGSQ